MYSILYQLLIIHVVVIIVVTCVLFHCRPISANDFSFEGYHCPLPWIRHESNFLTYDYYLDDGGLFSFLLYYANYFYPVNLNDHISRRSSVSSGSSDAALEQVQRVAIDRVNNWIKTRYA